MSEIITHTVHADDCIVLAQLSSGLDDRYKPLLDRYRADVRAGSRLRYGRFLYPLVFGQLRAREGTVRSEREARHLALAFGALSHRVADRYFKPRYPLVDDRWYEFEDEHVLPYPSDVRLMHDVVLIKERSELPANADDPRFHALVADYSMQTHEASGGLNVRQFERLWGARLVDELLELQTFPSEADANQWLTRYFERMEPIYINLSRYADAYYAPDPDEMRRFVREPNFYDRRDPLIRLAVAGHGGPAAAELTLEDALETVQEQSQWAQSLALGMDYFEHAQRYVNREIDEETFGAFWEDEDLRRRNHGHDLYTP